MTDRDEDWISEIESEDELNEVHLEECKTQIEYLETPSSEDGLGMDSNLDY